MTDISALFTGDQELLVWINQGLSNSFFDFILPWFRNKYFWIWLYLIIIIVAFKKDKRAWVLLVLAGVTILLCDGLSASIIKPWVQRLRPCNDPQVYPLINVLVHCGSGFSFVSAHAANHFGLAMVFSGYFAQWFNKKWLYVGFLFWAFIISFSQVYVGVHYPFDVFCGGLIGILIGGWVWRIYGFILANQNKTKN